MNSYLVFDIENNSSTISKKYGKKAGTPLLGDELVAYGLKSSAFLEVYGFYVYPNVIKEFNIDEDVLVGHNISHDLQWFWHLGSLQDFFKRGGRVWDTQLAHYILSGQTEKYPALRDIAVRCYGCPERQKLMEEYWEDTTHILDWSTKKILYNFPRITNNIEVAQYSDIHYPKTSIEIIHGNIQTSDISKELVLEDVKNDVLDTEQIYLQQLVIAEKQGQTRLIELMNDALLATFECSWNGMKIDLDTLQKNKLELEQKLAKKKAELESLILPFWR